MFFTQFLYNALLLNSFIPISLYVSMNFVRFLQAWFMNQASFRSGWYIDYLERGVYVTLLRVYFTLLQGVFTRTTT